jgi:hypothetical protein
MQRCDLLLGLQMRPFQASALHIALGGFAGSYADRGGTRHCRVCKDRWRTPEGDIVAREFDAAGTLSRRFRLSTTALCRVTRGLVLLFGLEIAPKSSADSAPANTDRFNYEAFW